MTPGVVHNFRQQIFKDVIFQILETTIFESRTIFIDTDDKCAVLLHHTYRPDATFEWTLLSRKHATRVRIQHRTVCHFILRVRFKVQKKACRIIRAFLQWYAHFLKQENLFILQCGSFPRGTSVKIAAKLALGTLGRTENAGQHKVTVARNL